MSRVASTLKGVLYPKSRKGEWIDISILAIFGTWFLAGITGIIYTLLFAKPDAYACGGPGFADYGCTGGSEAVIASVANVIFLLLLLTISVVSLKRITNRKKLTEKVKKGKI